jgi:hypothetical protein
VPALHPKFKFLREIIAGSAMHFDPACVAAFERCWPEIRQLMLDEAGGRD